MVAAPPSQRASLSFSPAAPATPWPRLLLRLNPLSALRRHQLPARALREGLPGQALASAISTAQVQSHKQSGRRNNILPGLQDVPPVLTRPLLVFLNRVGISKGWGAFIIAYRGGLVHVVPPSVRWA